MQAGNHVSYMRTTSSSPSNNVAARRTRAPRRVTDVARHRTTTLRCVAFTNGRLGMEISAGQWVRVRVTCTGNQCQSVAPKVQQWREFKKEILYTFEKSPLKPLKTQKKSAPRGGLLGGQPPRPPPRTHTPVGFRGPYRGRGGGLPALRGVAFAAFAVLRRFCLRKGFRRVSPISQFYAQNPLTFAYSPPGSWTLERGGD